MTEKRYIEGVKGFDDYDAWDNETEQGLSHSEVVNELNRLSEENEQLKKELESFEQVSFTDLCDGSITVLYMKKENVGDVE